MICVDGHSRNTLHGAAVPPSDEATTLAAATAGIEQAGWHVVGSLPSPVLGHHGAQELLLHARR